MLKKKKGEPAHHKPTPLTEMGYETEDFDVKKFSGGIVVLFGFVAVCAVLALGALWLLSPRKLLGFEDVPDPTRRYPEPPVPLPQSNITRFTDMYDLRQQETEKLGGYGVVDEVRGIYRIPIEEAINLTAERGLPKTPDVEQAGTVFGGVQEAGEPTPEGR